MESEIGLNVVVEWLQFSGIMVLNPCYSHSIYETACKFECIICLDNINPMPSYHAHLFHSISADDPELNGSKHSQNLTCSLFPCMCNFDSLLLFQLCNIFGGFVTCLYMILSCILVLRHEHVLRFLCIYY
jgi:hypothetical protein